LTLLAAMPWFVVDTGANGYHFGMDVSTGEFDAISTGYGFSLAIKNDGTLWAWGSNWYGGIGDGTTQSHTVPVKIMDDAASVLAVRYCAFAIKKDGSLWGWGKVGQLGEGSPESSSYDFSGNRTGDRLSPVKIMDGVRAVAAYESSSSGNTFAIKTDGSLWGWGYGVIGDGVDRAWDSHAALPVKIMDDVASVSTNSGSTMAIKTDGSLWEWGEGKITPVKIMDDAAYVTSSGWSHTAVIKTDGSLWTWGNNWNGQLGDGTNTDRGSPVKIMDGAASVSTNSYHTAAVKKDGSLWVWGSNRNGQVGDGTITQYDRDWNIIPITARYSPVKVMDGAKTVLASGNYTYALKTDGTFWAWGDNSNGQIGDGTQTTYSHYGCDEWDCYEGCMGQIVANNDRYTPVKVLDSVAAISTFGFDPYGGGPSMAIKTDGSLWEWGREGRYSPVKIMEDVKIPVVQTPQEEEPPAGGDDNNSGPSGYIYAPDGPGGRFIPSPTVLPGVTNPSSAINAIDGTLKSLTPEQRGSGDALDDLALFIENAVRRGASADLSGEELELAADLLRDLTVSAQDILKNADESLVSEGIGLLRGMRTNISIRSEETEAISISFPDELSDLGFDFVTVETGFAAVTLHRFDILSGDEIEMKQIAGGGKRDIIDYVLDFWSVGAVLLIFVIWAILFACKKRLRLWVVPTFCAIALGINAWFYFTSDSTGGPGIAINMTEGATAIISLPAEGDGIEYLALFNEDDELQYSKFNPLTGTIDARVRDSGVYTLKESKVEFSDIEDKPELMREAITQLASRGIMQAAGDGLFNPDGTITRAEVVAVIVNAFDILDKSAESTFTDMDESDWYYHAVASAAREGLVSGHGDGTFGGEAEIPKEQLVAMCTNTMTRRMGYRFPDDIEKYLTGYLDRGELSWSGQHIALATQSNIMIYRDDGLFGPSGIMTRGDAAIILYRVFCKVW
jgi:alpha-tubulin suppressor-like RCC1 family protein